MSLNQVGDVLTAITQRSTATIKFSVGLLPRGVYGVYRNGVKIYEFHLVTHPGTATVKSGAANDANPTGAQLTVTDVNNVSAKVDAAQFIGSLR